MESWMQMNFMIDGNKSLWIADITLTGILETVIIIVMTLACILCSVETNNEELPKYINIFDAYEYKDITLKFVELPCTIIG